MGNKFICEVCGKEVDCGNKNPANWKQKLCYTCRKAQNGQLSAPAKAPSVQKYEPQKAFNMEQYISDLLDVYEMLVYSAQGRNLDIPAESLCAWATSAMIQKGKING